MVSGIYIYIYIYLWLMGFIKNKKNLQLGGPTLCIGTVRVKCLKNGLVNKQHHKICGAQGL